MPGKQRVKKPYIPPQLRGWIEGHMGDRAGRYRRIELDEPGLILWLSFQGIAVSNMPLDAEIVTCSYDQRKRSLTIYVSSTEFEPVSQGQPVPLFDLKARIHYERGQDKG